MSSPVYKPKQPRFFFHCSFSFLRQIFKTVSSIDCRNYFWKIVLAGFFTKLETPKKCLVLQFWTPTSIFCCFKFQTFFFFTKPIMSGHKVCIDTLSTGKPTDPESIFWFHQVQNDPAKKKCLGCLVGWDCYQMWWSPNLRGWWVSLPPVVGPSCNGEKLPNLYVLEGKIGMFHCYMVTTLMQQSMMAMYVHVDLGILSHLEATWCVYLRVQIYIWHII